MPNANQPKPIKCLQFYKYNLIYEKQTPFSQEYLNENVLPGRWVTESKPRDLGTLDSI